MEDILIDIIKKSDSKKITIEMEMYAGGCAAVPTYIITTETNNSTFSAKSIDMEEAADKLLEKIETAYLKSEG